MKMRSLQREHPNFVAWRLVVDDEKISLVYDVRAARRRFLLIAGVAAILLGLFVAVVRSDNDGVFAVSVGVFGGIGILTLLLVGWVYPADYKNREPLFTYDRRSDVFSYPNGEVNCQEAKRDLSFSLELYRPQGEGSSFAELNLVWKKERLPFIGEMNGSGLFKLGDQLRGLGFQIDTHEIEHEPASTSMADKR